MKIRLFITGGTIDGLDIGKKVDKSLVPELLNKLSLKDIIECEVLMMKDSREIDSDDLTLIYEKCSKCEEDNIVITHGTMTMVETGKFLLTKNINKTIVLTGAMISADEKNSDALANLALALESAGSKPDGVYIAMNDKVFKTDEVKKNVEKGIFQNISE